MSEKHVDASLLTKLSPLNGLKRENLNALANKTRLQVLSGGKILFKEGDDRKLSFYILDGDLELRSGNEVVTVITGGSPEALNPIAQSIPRKVSARALNRIQFIVIDSDLLDVMLTWDQTGSYEVSELQQDHAAEQGDWMTTLLQTKAFHKIPPANIQAIFMRMQQINYKADDMVIKQGEEGDYFYVITEGRCLVTRETPLNKEGIKLAELGVGDTFGEEALISDAKRNATITLITDGSLMRLGKEDFNTLLNEPMLNWVDYEEAQNIVADGGFWLDVRLPSEYENFHQEDAINIPLYFIRLKLKMLDEKNTYVVCCDTGRRSSAGAYILSERGYDAFVLKGGLTMSDAPSG